MAISERMMRVMTHHKGRGASVSAEAYHLNRSETSSGYGREHDAQGDLGNNTRRSEPKQSALDAVTSFEAGSTCITSRAFGILPCGVLIVRLPTYNPLLSHDRDLSWEVDQQSDFTWRT